MSKVLQRALFFSLNDILVTSMASCLIRNNFIFSLQFTHGTDETIFAKAKTRFHSSLASQIEMMKVVEQHKSNLGGRFVAYNQLGILYLLRNAGSRHWARWSVSRDGRWSYAMLLLLLGILVLLWLLVRADGGRRTGKRGKRRIGGSKLLMLLLLAHVVDHLLGIHRLSIDTRATRRSSGRSLDRRRDRRGGTVDAVVIVVVGSSHGSFDAVDETG